MNDLISRQEAIKEIRNLYPDVPKINVCNSLNRWYKKNKQYIECEEVINKLPSVQPERLTDDDFETIRIHLNAQKEELCNQHRWKEAEKYQRIIDRFMAFASAQPERKTGKWIKRGPNFYTCSECARFSSGREHFCPDCGADMREETDNA